MSSFYKKHIIPIATTLLFLGLIGCGDGSGNNSSNLTIDTNESNSTVKAITLEDANVTIYKVKDDGSLSLLWKEKTSSGDTLEEIGEFNLHTNELTDDDFYLYKVTGGKDWDSDKNGILDESYTVNKGIFRSIAQGIDIKKAGVDFKISYTTELFYEEVVPTLKRKFDRATFPSILNNKVSAIIENSNDIQDILTFNPMEDKSKLKEFYKVRARKIVDDIHQGKIPALNMSAILGHYVSSQFEAFTLSSDGTLAYISTKDSLVILDISDLEKLTLIGFLDTKKEIKDIALSSDGTKAYLVNSNSFIVVDISNPNYPIKVGYYDIDNFSTIAISNDDTKAYVTNGNNFVILDISNPSKIIKLSSYNTEESYTFSRTITLSHDGTKAYQGYCSPNMEALLSSSCSLVVMDISNPLNPTKLDSFSMSGDITNITLSNDDTKAYVAGGDKGLIVIDISNPSSLTKLASFNVVGYAMDITLSNDGITAYVGDRDKGLVVFDISNLSNPIQLGSYNTGSKTTDIALSSDGTKAYLTNSTGFIVIDISNPINSPKLDSYGTVLINHGVSPNGSKKNIERVLNSIQNQFSILNSYNTLDSNILAVTLSNDNKAYAIDKNHGLVVIDTSNISNLIKLSSYNTEMFIRDIAISSDNSKAYITSDHGDIVDLFFSNSNDAYIGSLIVVDISELTNPIEISSYSWEGSASVVEISNDKTTAYILNSSGFVVVDISNPTNLTKLASYNISGVVKNVALSNDNTKAYITNSNGLIVLDISNPTNLIQIGLYRANSFKDITLSNDNRRAYITNSNGLIVLDISNPNNPIQLGSYNTIGVAENVILSDDSSKAYIANGANGITVIDISNSTSLSKISSYGTEGYAMDITLSNDETKAYVADGKNGLVVIDLDLYN